MTEKDRKEIRKIIREEIEAKLSTANKSSASAPEKPSTLKNESKGYINIDTVSPAY
jgi:hypothetical protein